MRLTKEESQAFVNAVIMEWPGNKEPNRHEFIFKGIRYKRRTMYWRTAVDIWESGDGGFTPFFLVLAWLYYLIRKPLFGSRYTVQRAGQKRDDEHHTLTRGASRQLWKFLKIKTREYDDETRARERAKQRREITNMLGDLGFNVNDKE